ncbi:MAG TPA: hypothetical protein V6D12_06970 [Candidatus Obscuribacterales bacterium]
MLKKVSTAIILPSLIFLLSEFLLIKPASCQTATQTPNQNSTIGTNSDANVVNQISPQNNAQNRNEINFPNIFPLNNPINTPVNTENDFGLNMSVGINTLDAANVTVYLGLIFQPGRTDSHKARMTRLQSETELLESQKQVNQAQLQLLQKQIAEAEVRLQRLQQSPDVVPPGSSRPNNDIKNPETVPMQSPMRN